MGFVRYVCFFVSNKAFSSSVNFSCSSFICSSVGSGTFSTGIGVPTEITNQFCILKFTISALLQSIQLVCHISHLQQITAFKLGISRL